MPSHSGPLPAVGGPSREPRSPVQPDWVEVAARYEANPAADQEDEEWVGLLAPRPGDV